MEHLNKTYYVSALVVISAAALFVCALISEQSISTIGALAQQISNVVTVDCIVIAIFVKWGWKWTALHPWFVPFPNLNGQWSGELYSKRNNEEGTRSAPIEVSVCIKQTFIRISCVMQTEQMKSTSGLAGFLLDPAAQQRQLVYTYCSRPKISTRERNPIHDGTAIFEIKGNPPTELHGEYWTSRGTSGEIILHRAIRLTRKA